MPRTRRSRTRKPVVSVDFTGVETSAQLDDGRYSGTITEVTKEESENGNEYLAWKFKVGGGTLYENTSLLPQALWKLKELLGAVGIYPDGVLEMDLEGFKDMELGVEVVNEEWEGRKRPRVAAYYALEEGSASEEEPEDDEEETPTPEKPRSRTKTETKGKRRRGRPKAVKVGAKVSFDDEGETLEGEIVEMDGDLVTVTTEDGEDWEMEKKELTVI